MKKILLLTFLVSFCGFSQTVNFDLLKFTDTIKENQKRKIEIRKLIDIQIINKLNNLNKKLDTLKLIYDIEIDKLGVLKLTDTFNKDKNINKIIKNIPIDSLYVLPFVDGFGDIFKTNLVHYSKYVKNVNAHYEWVEPVSHVPIYPGCKGNRDALLECMNIKVKKHINRKFNVDLVQDLGLSGGRKKIVLKYDINRQGKIDNIKVTGPHPKLIEEGIRIINLLPDLIPGKLDDEPIRINFSIPIIFNIED